VLAGRGVHGAVGALEQVEFLRDDVVALADVGGAAGPGVAAVVAVDQGGAVVAVAVGEVDPDDQASGVLAAGQLDAAAGSGGVPAPVGFVDDLAEAFGRAPGGTVVVAVLDIGGAGLVGVRWVVCGQKHDPAGVGVEDRHRVAAGGRGVGVVVGSLQDDLGLAPGGAVVGGAFHDQVDVAGVAAVVGAGL